jgi:F-type H+-transporting ATPase subunit alpha
MDKELELLIRQVIEEVKLESQIVDFGYVVKVSDCIVTAVGLNNVFIGEIVEFTNVKGMVLELLENHLSILVLGDSSKIIPKEKIHRTNESFKVVVNEGVLGRTLDGFGNMIDEMGPLSGHVEKMSVFVSSPPALMDRSPVVRQLVTGIKAIDALIPVGKGQRELILGDRSSGKTFIALTAMASQKDDPNFVSIYVNIGRPSKTIKQVENFLFANEVKNYVLIQGTYGAAMRYLAPYVGCAIGEYFCQKGKDVLMVYDDLNNHADSYREIALLLSRPAGREAYPADIFFLHANLLERAVSLSKELGGGTISALPIVETQFNDVSAYIPTNIISITDGQIFVDSQLFLLGVKPAINVGLSVSRVGGAAQDSVLKRYIKMLKLQLSQAEEYEASTKFSSQIDDITKKIIEKGKLIRKLLLQSKPVSLWKQILLFAAVDEGKILFADDVPKFEKELNLFENRSYEVLEGNSNSIREIIDTIGSKIGL